MVALARGAPEAGKQREEKNDVERLSGTQCESRKLRHEYDAEKTAQRRKQDGCLADEAIQPVTLFIRRRQATSKQSNQRKSCFI